MPYLGFSLVLFAFVVINSIKKISRKEAKEEQKGKETGKARWGLGWHNGLWTVAPGSTC